MDDRISDVLFAKIKDYRWKSKDIFNCSDTFRIRINKKGKIDLVDVDDEEMKELYEKDEYRYCTRSIKKALKGLKFDIIKRRGQPIEEYVIIEIFFEDDGSIENWSW